MTVDQMRNALIEAYPGPLWALKVKNMENRQVIAIYKNLKTKGKLYKHKWKSLKEPKIQYEQLNMFDLLEDK